MQRATHCCSHPRTASLHNQHSHQRRPKCEGVHSLYQTSAMISVYAHRRDKARCGTLNACIWPQGVLIPRGAYTCALMRVWHDASLHRTKNSCQCCRNATIPCAATTTAVKEIDCDMICGLRRRPRASLPLRRHRRKDSRRYSDRDRARELCHTAKVTGIATNDTNHGTPKRISKQTVGRASGVATAGYS